MVLSLNMINIILICSLTFLYIGQCINQIKLRLFFIFEWLFSRKREAHKTTLSSEKLKKWSTEVSLKNY